MSGRCILLIVALAVAALISGPTNAGAVNRDQGSLIKIYEPTAIPGQPVLLPGTYVVKRLPTATQVVQILNESQTRVYATLFVHDFETLQSVLQKDLHSRR